MKTLISKLIQLRNPNFKMSDDLDSRTLLAFSSYTFFALVRGLKMLSYGKAPKFTLAFGPFKLHYPHKISFGKFLKLEENVYLSGLSTAGIQLGKDVSIGAHSRIVVSTTLNNPGAFINIGNNVGIGAYAYVGGAGGCSIGDNCIIGQYLSCHPENHNYQDGDVLIRHQGVERKGISIGKNCWIGSKVTILDGVEIGNNNAIAAGSVVTRSFGDNCIIGGIPARILKTY